MKKRKHSKITGRLKRSPPPHHIISNTKLLPYPQRPRTKKNAMLRPIKRS